MIQPSAFARLLVAGLIAALLLTACAGGGPGVKLAESDGSGAAPQTISVSGAFALFPLMTLWAEEYHNTEPALMFDVQAGGAGKGMTDVLSGAADIAMLSREPRPEELAQGTYLVPVTIDSVVATVNADNPYLEHLRTTGISGESGARIWLSTAAITWGELLGTTGDDRINVYTRSDSSGAAEMWARFLGAQAQEELRGTGVNGDPGLAEAVRQDRFGIGYNNVGFAYDQATGQPIAGLAVVPIDINGDGRIAADEDFYGSRDAFVAAVGTGRYPFPPARVLYLVTKGEPGPAIKAFYRWILTGGQAFVEPAGYVKLDDQRIASALDALGQ